MCEWMDVYTKLELMFLASSTNVVSCQKQQLKEHDKGKRVYINMRRMIKLTHEKKSLSLRIFEGHLIEFSFKDSHKFPKDGMGDCIPDPALIAIKKK